MSNTREPVCLTGTYDANGVIHCDPNGNENIRVEFTKTHNHLQASVYVNEINQGFVTFGLSNERAISTFAQGGCWNENQVAESIHNIISVIH
ncbi:hypothetical protein [Photobacterium phage PDCC-1]|uniref:Uncharacterized protein n=1 Tax=Photobacterium phage PDCC-1 TaxID=2664246 RepID=A0A6B9JDW7_9CAUD|nr:hypothetical protein HWC77_gp093 [Photobacterium phage PDCC-1]QGZ14456.1 hypothetical protein [Photobacterium phage PDCC-1]